jgi:threonine dehydrogenase-like Zn-dependent dehydrogenase
MNSPTPPDQLKPFSPSDMYDRELVSTTKYSADHSDIYQLLRFFNAKRLEPKKAITHRFELDGIVEAFDLLAGGLEKGGESLKSIIYPNGIME